MRRGWSTSGLTVVKAGELLARGGVVVPERTLHRYAVEVLGCGPSARGTTVRVADGEPGVEVQVDFGKMGLIDDAETGRRRVVHALIFTAVLQQALLRVADLPPDDRGGDRRVRGGLDVLRWGLRGRHPRQHVRRSWTEADPTEPRFNRGVRRVRPGPGFRDRPGQGADPDGQAPGRTDRSLCAQQLLRRGDASSTCTDAQRRAEAWCADHGRGSGCTAPRSATRRGVRPRRHPGCSPPRRSPYDLPIYPTAKVHRDHHIEVAKAIYSVPGRPDRPAGRGARRLASWSRSSTAAELIKIHPRQPPGRRGHRPRRPAR